MAKSGDRLATADKVVSKADTYWSLGQKLWEARSLVAPALILAGVVTAALSKVFNFINQYGWAGWALVAILALVPSMLLWSVIDWLLHLRRMRQIEERLKASSDVTQQKGGQVEGASETPQPGFSNHLEQSLLAEIDNVRGLVERLEKEVVGVLGEGPLGERILNLIEHHQKWLDYKAQGAGIVRQGEAVRARFEPLYELVKRINQNDKAAIRELVTNWESRRSEFDSATDQFFELMQNYSDVSHIRAEFTAQYSPLLHFMAPELDAMPEAAAQAFCGFVGRVQSFHEHLAGAAMFQVGLATGSTLTADSELRFKSWKAAALEDFTKAAD